MISLGQFLLSFGPMLLLSGVIALGPALAIDWAYAWWADR